MAKPLLALSAAALAAAAVVVHRRSQEAERRHPPTGKIMTVDGVRLHFLDTGGTGPTVVLLHGNGAMAADMEISGLVDAAARRYRVIAIDRPGYGHSSRPRARMWTPRAEADLFVKAFAALGLERPVVFGHSWGTQVAAALALDHPEAIGGLVLSSGYYFPTARADVLLLSPPAIPVVGDVMRHTISPLLGKALAPAMIKKMFSPDPVPERFDREFPLGLSLRPSQIRTSSEETAFMVPAAAGMQGRYGEIRLPTVILAGEEDQIADVGRQSKRLHEAIPGSELRVLPGHGHMVHHFATDEMVDAIDTVTERARETAREAAE